MAYRKPTECRLDAVHKANPKWTKTYSGPVWESLFLNDMLPETRNILNNLLFKFSGNPFSPYETFYSISEASFQKKSLDRELGNNVFDYIVDGVSDLLTYASYYNDYQDHFMAVSAFILDAAFNKEPSLKDLISLPSNSKKHKYYVDVLEYMSSGGRYYIMKSTLFYNARDNFIKEIRKKMENLQFDKNLKNCSYKKINQVYWQLDKIINLNYPKYGAIDAMSRDLREIHKKYY